jgi:osmotically inducible protein OsmC
MATTQDKSASSEVLRGSAAAVWNGDSASGTGTLRFELGAGGELPLAWQGSSDYGHGATTPEELAAGAHAACMALTLAHTLTRAGHTPRTIVIEARTSFDLAPQVREIRRSELAITVDVDGLSEAGLARAAEVAGRYCPVSNTLRAAGVALAMHVRLISE